MIPDKQWFIEAYDRAAREEGAAASPEKLRDIVARWYAEGVDLGKLERPKRTVDDEGRAYAKLYVGPERERRRTAILRDGAWLLSALRDETILGRDDPHLDMAYPVGDGTDKTLRSWTVDDWNRSRTERYAKAQQATDAARRYDDEVVTPAIREMQTRGAVMFGDLFFQYEDGDDA